MLDLAASSAVVLAAVWSQYPPAVTNTSVSSCSIVLRSGIPGTSLVLTGRQHTHYEKCDQGLWVAACSKTGTHLEAADAECAVCSQHESGPQSKILNPSSVRGSQTLGLHIGCCK